MPLLAIGVVHVVRTRLWRHDHAQCLRQHFGWGLLVLYLVLPTCTNVIFSAFRCDDDFGVHGKSFLVADYGTECSGDRYKLMILPWAIVSVIVYPVGVNVFYAVVLWRQADESKHPNFPTGGYSPRRFFWEPIDSVRRCAMCGLPVFFGRAQMQLATGVLLALFFQLLYLWAEPYHRPEDSRVSAIANFEITFTLQLLMIRQGFGDRFSSEDALGVLCIAVNLIALPTAMFFQLRNVKRAFDVFRMIDQGRCRDAYQEQAVLAQIWSAGPRSRKLLRSTILRRVESSMDSMDPETAVDATRLVSLPIFRYGDFGDDGLGVVIERSAFEREDEQTLIFATLASPQGHEHQNSRAIGPAMEMVPETRNPVTAEEGNAHEPTSKAILTDIIRGTSTLADVRWAEQTIVFDGETNVFETPLAFLVLSLARHQPRKLINLAKDEIEANSVLKFPTHFLMQVSGLTATDLHNVLDVAEPKALYQRDESKRRPFYFLKHRHNPENGSERRTRSDHAITELIVGVALANPRLTQILLEQSAEHEYTSACERLIAECGADADANMRETFDTRTVRQIGIAGGDASLRSLFHTVGMFLNRFQVERSLHISATCNLISALDVTSPVQQRVAIKSIKEKAHFERELASRGWQKQHHDGIWSPPLAERWDLIR